MRKLILLAAFALSSAVLAAPMTNDDVIRLVQSGVGDALVIQTIDGSEPFFDTSVDGIVRLKQAGVSDPVIQRMIAKRTGAPAPGPVQGGSPGPAAAPIGAPAGIPPQAVCRDCGVIEYVRELERQGQATGTGAVAGGLTGAVVGRGVSNNRNRTFGTIAGGVVGAVAGHQVERSIATTKYWEVVIRFDDGTARAYNQDQVPHWRRGDRVRVTNGVIGPL